MFSSRTPPKNTITATHVVDSFYLSYVSGFLQPDINKFPSAHNRGHGFRKFKTLHANLAHHNLSRSTKDIPSPRKTRSDSESRLQDISTMVKKTSKTARCADIPIGAAHISFSGQHRMGYPTSKTKPQVPPRWPRSLLGSDQHLDKHWPGGLKIKMTLGLANPREG